MNEKVRARRMRSLSPSLLVLVLAFPVLSLLRWSEGDGSAQASDAEVRTEVLRPRGKGALVSLSSGKECERERGERKRANKASRPSEAAADGRRSRAFKLSIFFSLSLCSFQSRFGLSLSPRFFLSCLFPFLSVFFQGQEHSQERETERAPSVFFL